MKLELERLAPYLPYGLNIGYFFEDKMICKSPMVSSMIGNSFAKEIPINTILENDGSCKPILRPLSDLFNGNYEDILDEFSEVSLESFKIAFLSDLKPLNAFDKINYTIAIKLFENHFDVFGLIDKNLAIDINTLK